MVIYCNENENYYVYILQCFDGTLYTGIAKNLTKRVDAHNAGRGAVYTKARLPVELLWSTNCDSKSEALKLEYKIKQLKREHKFKLMRDGVII